MCCPHENKRKTFLRRIYAAFLAAIFFIGAFFLILFLVWLIFRPTKPAFILENITYSFNTSGPHFFTSNIQITLSSRNPNGDTGIYYDKLDIYASYNNQQVTLPTSLPPSYQGPKDVTLWSPILYGNSVPVAPYISQTKDQMAECETLLFNFNADGIIRWNWKLDTLRYYLKVNCPVYISFCIKNGFAVGSSAVNLVLPCHVDDNDICDD